MELDCLNFSVDQEHNVGVYNDVLRLAAAAATPTANHDNSLPLQVAYETIMAFTEQGLPPKRATFAALLALALRMDPSFQVLNSLVNVSALPFALSWANDPSLMVLRVYVVLASL